MRLVVGYPTAGPAEAASASLQAAGEILEAYREHLGGSDPAWLQAHWPRLQRAIEFMILTWDKDEDGLWKARRPPPELDPDICRVAAADIGLTARRPPPESTDGVQMLGLAFDPV